MVVIGKPGFVPRPDASQLQMNHPKGGSSEGVLGVRTPTSSGPMMNIITSIPQSRAHKGASCYGVLFLDDASFKSDALHSSYIIQAWEEFNLGMGWWRRLIYNDIVSYTLTTVT